MQTAEIRRRFLEHFAQRGHTVVPSASLVSPDPSLLFTVAGMVPFKPYFLGQETPPYKRATSVQKCVRTLDIDEVGKTTRHGTFFQMNGNFSFGDYFKAGAIELAWELITRSVADGGYGLDESKIWGTVYQDDDEAIGLWRRLTGIPMDRIVRRGMKDNFWSMGVPGPAGPCSEIYLDRGPEYGPDGGPEVDEDRYLEFWNLVFMEYERGPGGEKDGYELLRELPAKNIDTGMGLERMALLLQGVDNLYEIDEVFPVIRRVEEISGRRYGADHEADVRMRVVADHVRSGLMLITDGVTPSNEARGYVLRRLLRRAVRSLRLLGVDEPVLLDLVRVSADRMQLSYPEVQSEFGRTSQVVEQEEEAFRRTLASGTTILDTAVKRAKQAGAATLSGSEAFQLHDTYGFPIDLTLEMAAEQGLEVDEGEFRRLMNEQRRRAKEDARAKKTGHADVGGYRAIADRLAAPVVFTGYDEIASEGRVAGLLVERELADVATEGQQVEVVLDRTPFYAEGGGQLADAGRIEVDGALVVVDDVQSPVTGLIAHRARVLSGELRTGALAQALVDVLEVHAEIMTQEQARAAGAMALFGEKYGDRVRVISVGEWARELCGGTHAARSGQLGLVTLLGEGSIGSGVRRVEALVGSDAYAFSAREHVLLAQLTDALKVRPEELPDRVAGLLGQLRDAQKEIDRYRAAQVQQLAAQAAQSPRDVFGVSLVAQDAGESAPDELRTFALDVRGRMPVERPAVVAVGGVVKGRPQLVVATNEEARRWGLTAGDPVRAGAAVPGGHR